MFWLMAALTYPTVAHAVLVTKSSIIVALQARFIKLMRMSSSAKVLVEVTYSSLGVEYFVQQKKQ